MTTQTLKAEKFKGKTAGIGQKVSILINLALMIGKFLLAYFFGIFFLISGLVNLFWVLSRGLCYYGIKHDTKIPFEKINSLIGAFVLLAGSIYAIYMLTLVFAGRQIIGYGMVLSIAIAAVSFFELGLAIYGIFDSKGKGQLYRDIKLIDLCAAMTAIIWTEVALLSFAYDGNSNIICGISGAVVGLVIFLVGVFITFAAKFSIQDRTHNTYILTDDTKQYDNGTDFEIKLLKSKVYGDYTYRAKFNDGEFDGEIERGEGLLGKLNLLSKILVIILSEILIFVYAIGALIYLLRSMTVLKKLDTEMRNMGFINKNLIIKKED